MFLCYGRFSTPVAFVTSNSEAFKCVLHKSGRPALVERWLPEYAPRCKPLQGPAAGFKIGSVTEAGRMNSRVRQDGWLAGEDGNHGDSWKRRDESGMWDDAEDVREADWRWLLERKDDFVDLVERQAILLSQSHFLLSL